MQNYLFDYMIRNGGNFLRYRTLTELCHQTDSKEVMQIRNSLRQSEDYRLWISRLSSCTDMHNGTNDRFENIVGKLVEFGVTNVFNELHQNMKRFLQQLEHDFDPGKRGMFSTLCRTILTMGLARTGYFTESVVLRAAQNRIEEVYEATNSGSYEIFLPTNEEPRKPGNFNKYRVLNSHFCNQGSVLVPYIYDLYLFASIPPEILGARHSRMVDQIVRYILSDVYQSIPNYGICVEDHDGRLYYFAVGWNVHLPLYLGDSLSDRDRKILLMRLELMSSFRNSACLKWMDTVESHCANYRNDDLTYTFPAIYMTEMKEGYWVLGNHMAIDPNRKHPNIRTFEFTFRILKAQQEN